MLMLMMENSCVIRAHKVRTAEPWSVEEVQAYLEKVMKDVS